MNAIVPRCSVIIRPAVAGDYAFVDRLQDMHSKALGFLRKAALEGKINAGEVLIAEENRVSGFGVRGSGEDEANSTFSDPIPETRTPKPEPIGYCIFSDRYFKRDEVGIV